MRFDRGTKVMLAVGAGILAVALIGIVLFALAQDDDSSDDAPGDPTAVVETNAVEIDGSPLPLLTSGDPVLDPALGTPAPDARGTGFDGLGVDLLTDDQPTVIGFFAHWCPVCQREVDELSEHLGDAGLPTDVRLVAVSTSVRPDEGNFPPSAWFANEGWPAPVLLDDRDGSLAEAYGLPAFPLWVIVDTDGNVAARLSGAIGPDEFEDLLDLARMTTPRER